VPEQKGVVHLRVSVDRQRCEGHSLCLELAPEVFELSEDDVATCSEFPDPVLTDRVLTAAAACPRQAISIAVDPSDGRKAGP
jgi:ferredoxin